MRLSKPRIQPLKDEEFTPEQKERLGKAAERVGGVLNLTTIASRGQRQRTTHCLPSIYSRRGR